MAEDWGSCNEPGCMCDGFVEPPADPNALWCSRCGHIFHLHLGPYTPRSKDNESEVLGEAGAPAPGTPDRSSSDPRDAAHGRWMACSRMWR